MLEFKLNYYFEKYKNAPASSSTKFKSDFIKKHGEFALLSELVVMIQRYQLKRYGEILAHGAITVKRCRKTTYNNLEIIRNISRFGTKEERRIRKLEETHARK